MSTYEYKNDSAGSTHTRQYPLSYILSGYYYLLDGTLAALNKVGYVWSSTPYDEKEAMLFNFSGGTGGSKPYYELYKAI